MRVHKIVKVEWIDSSMFKGWRGKDKAKDLEPSVCMSCGVLVKTKRGSIGVTHSVGEDEFADTMVIPRSVIKKIEVLGRFRA